MLFNLYDSKLPRYERQLKNVDYLVVNTINKDKDINITKDELYKVLEVLYEYRVIE